MISIELDKEQSRKVTVSHIADTLITMKQYLDESQIAKYRFILNEFANLIEIEEIQKRFDKTWPDDVKFYE